MGQPMAANLAREGFAVKSFDLKGNGNCKSIREAAKGADALITMLPDGDAVREAVLEALPALPAGAIVVDMSSRARRRALLQEHRARGCARVRRGDGGERRNPGDHGGRRKEYL